MPYIAKTNGTDQIEDWRDGTLADLASNETGWVQVQVVEPFIDPVTHVRSHYDIAVSQGGAVTMTLLGHEMPAWWRRMNLRRYLANKRWKLEIGGVTWNGFPVHTSREARGNMLTEFVAVGAGLRTDGDPWKFADGVSRALSNAEFVAMAMHALAFVKAAFAVETELQAAITADTVTSVAQIDAAEWPSRDA